MKPGYLVQYCVNYNRQTEVGRVYSWTPHRVFVVTDSNGRAQGRQVPRESIKKVIKDSPDIDELLTHSHRKMRNLGLRLLERTRER